MSFCGKFWGLFLEEGASLSERNLFEINDFVHFCYIRLLGNKKIASTLTLTSKMVVLWPS